MAAIPNIKNLDLKQLQDLHELVGERIEEMKVKAEAEFIAEVQQLADERGLDYGTIVKSMKKTKRKTVAVAAKYKDPDTGKTWSGMGRKPKWFIEAIEQGGKTKEDLVI